MRRLILIPQYPTKLRYQEWWLPEFTEQYAKYFDEVIVLCPDAAIENTDGSSFSPINTAIEFETKQIVEYMALPLFEDDVLLLNDLSFPGLFSNILFHKRPKKCFAICHATAKNRYDLFQPDRDIKYPIEKTVAKLFDTVFVGSEYHAKKLGWPNLEVSKLPNYPIWLQPKKGGRTKKRMFASVSRTNRQKVTKNIETWVQKRYGVQIYRPNANTWSEYFHFLQETEFLLITSKEETYGYQVIDALINNCIPLAPNAFSYPELLDSSFLYKDTYELDKRISYWMNRASVLKAPKEDFFGLTSKIMQRKKY